MLMIHLRRGRVCGLESGVRRNRTQNAECKVQNDERKRTLDCGPWTLDFGPWTLDYRLWTLDRGLKTQRVQTSFFRSSSVSPALFRIAWSVPLFISLWSGTTTETFRARS